MTPPVMSSGHAAYDAFWGVVADHGIPVSGESWEALPSWARVAWQAAGAAAVTARLEGLPRSSTPPASPSHAGTGPGRS